MIVVDKDDRAVAELGGGPSIVDRYDIGTGELLPSLNHSDIVFIDQTEPCASA